MTNVAESERPPVPSLRAVFFGTPKFAVPCLDALVEIAEVTAVATYVLTLQHRAGSAPEP